MGNGAARHAPMLSLKQLVELYASLTEKFGEPVALAAFRLNELETQSLFSTLDDDYHISRFLHFSRLYGKTYLINGEAATHVAIEPAINSLL